MNRYFSLLVLLALAACGSGKGRNGQSSAAAPQPPKEYTYRIVATHPHATDAYTQGLFWADGLLWEGTGQNGASRIQTLDLATGRTRQIAALPASEFGEGIALVGGELFQLTWQSNTAHVYDAATGRELRTHRYPGEGWGLTSDGQRLYMSNGSATIYTLDPATFRRQGSICVTIEGEPLGFLNELEWIDGRIWANIYTTDRIAIIDPATGRVEGLVDLHGLLPDAQRGPETDVLNGIAWDAAGRRLWVTGKNWPTLYEIELIEQ